MSGVSDVRQEALYDLLEDTLVKGWKVEDGKIDIDDLGPLVDTARALLMLHRGVDPIMPKGAPA